MSAGAKVSLIDLSKQFHFEIDDSIKEKICFGETLLIGCGHFEGQAEDQAEDDSDSEWSCHSTTESEPEKTNLKKPEHEYEIEDRVEVESDKKSQSDDDEHDFHTFFFPDCSKPLPPTNSKASVIMGPDGMPQINTDVRQGIEFCVCKQDPKTMECKCITKIPCSCGAKVLRECTCANLERICTCHEGDPKPECSCKPSKTCVCNPDDKVRPDCPCDNVIPCVCDPTRLDPYPVCTCKHKPGQSVDDESFGSFEGAEPEYYAAKHETIPCDCQKPMPKKRCLCLKGQTCSCDIVCVCDIRKTCVCESEDGEPPKCETQESKSICSCPVPQICTCDAEPDGICKCYPEPKPTQCTCENPENCKCFSVCECTSPCICDIQTKKLLECTCTETNSIDCTCHPKSIDLSPLKLKKTRAGKHNYRWCHDVDPRHTYFDYEYGRHDKISHKEEKKEKLKILGLYEEKRGTETSAADIEIDAPEYKKHVRKPSIDCCSTLGGMSIGVECLGESKDKFLVQVTSHFSKEGAKAGTKLVGILDCNLHTMEENRTEHIQKKDTIKERKSYMAICDTGYYNKITKICGDRHVVKRFYHSFEDAHSFLLEGANIVLLRYFALARYRGKIKTDTVLIDGVVCESIYVCHGVSQAIVNGKTMFVCKVERHIIEASGVVHQTLTVLSLRGYLICHEWADTNYIVHINPLLKTTPEKDLIEEHNPLRKHWREDLQLLSDYLDFKSARSSEGARYTSESSALTNAVRDYLQALLSLRPQDAIHFTRHYFKATLSSLDLPHNDYFDAGTKHVRYFFFED
ncbi:uncharacterized protein LOC134792128 [Cydia splendana]|uniref:uncharacterized protein LOC134792128 n=1 Tax=Cydia splendana TaxID=1100963 RepID=UPI002142712C